MVRWGGERFRRASAALVVLGLVVAACGGREEAVVPGTSSSAITTEVPDDWKLIEASVDDGQPRWGEECCGSTEPYTVIKRVGGDRTIKVSATGAGAFALGLEEASAGYMGDSTELEVDGRQARLAEGSEPGVLDLVIEADDTTFIRAEGADATRDELVKVASNATVGPDHRLAPVLESLPGGFELVGSVHTPGVIAMYGSVIPTTKPDELDERTHALGWTIGPAGEESDQTTVLLSALPANTIDLSAVELGEDLPAGAAKRTEVAGRPALTIEESPSLEESPLDGERRSTVITTSAWGDQLVAVGSGNGETVDLLPSMGQLEELVASAAQADAGTWDQLVIKAAGGPGLNPDPGQQEVVRGKVGDVEWLLQTGNAGFSSSTVEPLGVDPCLKVSDGTGGCPTGGSGSTDPAGGGGIAMAHGELGPDRFAFVGAVVPEEDPTVTLQLTRPDGATETAGFHPVHGAATRAAVLVTDEAGQFQCEGAGPGMGSGSSGPSVGRIERLDAQGKSLGCLQP